MKVRSNNNFDVIRFGASVLVLFSHSFSLVLASKAEPLASLTNGRLTNGKVAVIIFFILSGFLIAASWVGKRSFYTFLEARVRRIFPGLAAVLVITMTAGFFLTSVSVTEYSKSAFIYFLKNFTLYKLKYDIAGIFMNNPYGSAVNGSLWTLRHEFTCYMLIAMLGYLSNFHLILVWLLWSICVSTSLFTWMPIYFFQEFLPLCGWFLAGTLAYLYRDLRLNFIELAIAVFIILIVGLSGFDLLLTSPVIAYFLVRLAYTPSIFSNFGKYGDFSYGIYIYAFPVQQFVIYLITKSVLSPMTWWMVFLVSFPITMLFAVASWHLVEKRFLKRRSIAL